MGFKEKILMIWLVAMVSVSVVFAESDAEAESDSDAYYGYYGYHHPHPHHHAHVYHHRRPYYSPYATYVHGGGGHYRPAAAGSYGRRRYSYRLIGEPKPRLALAPAPAPVKPAPPPPSVVELGNPEPPVAPPPPPKVFPSDLRISESPSVADKLTDFARNSVQQRQPIVEPIVELGDPAPFDDTNFPPHLKAVPAVPDHHMSSSSSSRSGPAPSEPVAPFRPAAAAHRVAPVAAPAVLPEQPAVPVAAPLAAPVAAPAAAPLAAPAVLAEHPVSDDLINEVLATQYHAQDEFGNVAYGYANPNSAKQESRDSHGNVIGTYSYVDGSGVAKHVSYVADDFGFRVTSTNALPPPVV